MKTSFKNEIHNITADQVYLTFESEMVPPSLFVPKLLVELSAYVSVFFFDLFICACLD